MYWGLPVTGERKEEYLLLFLWFSLILLPLYYSVWVVWGFFERERKEAWT